MAIFDNIDTSYLDDASNRVVQMIGVANPGIQVLRYIDPNLTPPFWWVYIGRIVLQQKSEDIMLQTYGLNCRYVMGILTQGIDGKAQEGMLTALPAAISYLFGHKRLVFRDSNGELPYLTAPRYFDPSRVMIQEATTLGAFKDGTNQVGIEVEILLPFTLSIDQE